MKVLQLHKGLFSSVVQCLFDLVLEKFHEDNFGTMVCLGGQGDGEACSSILEKIHQL